MHHLDNDSKCVFLPFRVKDLLSEFYGCLADSRGKELKFDPDNEKTPPDGFGIQLTYKSLPLHTTKQNKPIPISDVDNFGRLYCPEFTKKVAHFKVSTADSSSLLNIVAKASCFPLEVRRLAAVIRDQVRYCLLLKGSCLGARHLRFT